MHGRQHLPRYNIQGQQTAMAGKEPLAVRYNMNIKKIHEWKAMLFFFLFLLFVSFCLRCCFSSFYLKVNHVVMLCMLLSVEMHTHSQPHMLQNAAHEPNVPNNKPCKNAAQSTCTIKIKMSKERMRKNAKRRDMYYVQINYTCESEHAYNAATQKPKRTKLK